MAAIKRSADVVWEGTIARGEGQLSGGSGACRVPGHGRFTHRRSGGQDDPGGVDRRRTRHLFHDGARLCPRALAHAAERLAVNTVVTLEEVDGQYTITSSELDALGM